MKRVVIVLLSALACCIGAVGIYLIVTHSDSIAVERQLQEEAEEMELLRRKVWHSSDDSVVSTSSVFWSKLSNMNPDIFAWLYIPNTNISYPLLQERTLLEYFYLDHDYMAEHSNGGAIFTPAEPHGVEDAHLLLFGHHTKNKDVAFSSLYDFFSTDNKGKNNSIAYMIYPDRVETWTLWCACESVADDMIYEIPYILNSDGYQELLDNIRRTSIYSIGSAPSKRDNILVLSTCNGQAGGTERFYVVFKRYE